jgi:tetraacyldisaccharide 4'-kinase
VNPGALVIEATDRASGIQIGADSGADVAVLDDAFQHRRAAREIDIVLISADDWTGKQRLLPAGPYREPVEELRRASIVMITRKIAPDSKVNEIEGIVTHAAPNAIVAVASLVPGALVDYAQPGRTMDPAELSGKSVLAVAGIGNPRAFVRQMEETGARVVSMEFPDHHAFGLAEILDIAARSRTFDCIVCTLKDAVKLGPQWPADAGPLWYVSLSVNVERGEAAIDEILLRIDRFKDIR